MNHEYGATSLNVFTSASTAATPAAGRNAHSALGLTPLVAEGFVLFESARRTVVRRLTPTDVKELFELREALEVYAAGLAASRATPEALAELRELLTSAAAGAGDAETITDVNTRFHDRILALAGNSLLIAVMEPVDGRLRWLTRRNEEWPQLLTEHRELYEAIASGDPDRARAHALSHVRANYESTVRHLFGDDSGRPAS
ncbi:GntR family transcriptional regulator [Streptomyces sp. P17]|uniref:GntR family transcriptional regulator n=1 Tax=Streptomyces sp. P17 TaxID=3074716 RepID=UPI0028F421B4|nr:GntR family transcriptional regulator [Streptomyces sp. P17]MDT9694582.1 GntR family transcriptional regulator [Streptomyces sp. P17]